MSRTSSDDVPIDLDARELAGMFAPPAWLRDLGILAWILVGVGVFLVGVIWLLAEVSTIVMREEDDRSLSRWSTETHANGRPSRAAH